MVPLLFLGALVAGVLAEPPVGRQYLPPSALSSKYGAPGVGNNVPMARYGPPSSFGGLGRSGSLSTQYGAPSSSNGFGSRSGPSTQYGVPSASSRFGSNNGLSTRYGAPAGSRNVINGLSTQYGAPSSSRGFNSNSAPSTQYGAPSGLGGLRGVSTQYGAPSANSALSAQYGVPSVKSGLSTQYGAPSAISNFGSRTGLSTEYGAPAGGYGYGRGGAQEDPLAEPANYEFNYAVEDAESGSDFGHEERRQDENAQGQYRVLLPDGRLQIVDYEADQEGFKPSIRYEETGLGAQGYARGPAGASGYNRGAKAGGPY